MIIGIITHDRKLSTNTVPHVITELEKTGTDYQLLVPDDINVHVNHNQITLLDVKGNSLECSVVLNALGGPTNKGLVLVETLELMNVRVVNPSLGWRRAKIKPLSSVLFSLHNVAHPETIFSISWNSLGINLMDEELGYPLVAKPWRGARGVGVRFVDDDQSLIEAVQSGKTSYLYFQRFINHNGRHIRSVVVGESVIGAIYREHQKGQLITNAVTGFGRPSQCELDSELEALSLEAVSCLGLDIGGVDIVEDSRGYQVIEVNAWPSGYQDFLAATGVSIPREIVRYLLSISPP